MINIVIGIVILLFSAISVWVCVARTPDHLQGWYGTMYGVIALGGIVGSIWLILSGAGVF